MKNSDDLSLFLRANPEGELGTIQEIDHTAEKNRNNQSHTNIQENLVSFDR